MSFDPETGEVQENVAGAMIISPTIGNLAAALATAQGAFEHPPKDRTVKVALKTGGSYTFSYATLDAIMKAVKTPLAENGLAIVQIVLPVGNVHKLRTMLLHASGEYIGCEVPLLVNERSNQAFGSALTYMRRYTVSALLGVVADEDDDANTADGNQATQQPRQQVTRPVAQQVTRPVAQSAPASAPAKGGPTAPAPAASSPPTTTPAGVPNTENPAPVEFTEAPGRVATPPTKPGAPVAKNSPEYKQGLTDFTTIKQKLAAAATKADLTALVGEHKGRLDEISDLGAEPAKAIVDLLARVDTRMKALPDAEGERI